MGKPTLRNLRQQKRRIFLDWFFFYFYFFTFNRFFLEVHIHRY